MSRGQKLVKNTAILAIGTMFSSVFSFLVIPIFSRWLSADDYGTYDLFLTYTSLLLPFLTLACGEACFRFLLEAKTNTEKSDVLSSSLFIVVVGTILGCIGVSIVFLTGRSEEFIPFLCLLISSILLRQTSYIARGFRKFSVYTLSNVLDLIALAVSVTYFVYFKQMGLRGIIYGNSIAHMVGAIYVIVRLKLWEFICFNKPNFVKMKEILIYSMPLIPNTVAWWIVNVSDRTIIRIALGASFNGVYAIANKIPSMCSTMFGVFHMSWQESAIDSLNDVDRNQYFNSIFNKVVPFCISVGMCILSINKYIYQWIWDPKYIAGKFQVWILITAIMFSFLSQFLGGIMVAEKRTKANGATTCIAAAINVVVNLALIKILGLYAASYSTLVAYVFLFVTRAILIRKSYSIKLAPKTGIAIVTYGVVVGLQFESNVWIGIFSVFLAICVSLYMNWDLIMDILKRFLKGDKKINEQ